MLRLVIRKELLHNLLNARFVGACIVSTVLILLSVAISTNTYKRELHDFRDRLKVQDDFIGEYGHLNRVGGMTSPQRGPSHFEPLVLGIDREVLEGRFESNPIPLFFSRIDLITIVTVILSLIAIIFSYNVISGERESGLLKQTLSTSLPRRTVVLGKFIGGCLSLLVPFTIGVLSGLLYIALSPDVITRATDTAVFAVLIAASWLYISAFYALGLLVSARSQTSGTAVLKSIFAWALLVLVLPNVSPFLAARLYRIPSKTVIQNQIWSISAERFSMQSKRTQDLITSKYADIADVLVDVQHVVGHVPSKIQEKVTSDPLFRKRYEEFSKEWRAVMDRIDIEVQERIDVIQTDYDRRAEHQEDLAILLASFSPPGDLVFAATDLTEAGIQADNHWHRQVEAWQNQLTSYLQVKWESERKRDPSFTPEDHVDLSDRPRVEYAPEGIEERARAALPHLGALVLFNLVFLGGAVASFQRYDVR